MATVVLSVLTVDVWLTYSKSLTCCEEVRRMAGCPADVTQPCLGCAWVDMCVSTRAKSVAVARFLVGWKLGGLLPHRIGLGFSSCRRFDGDCADILNQFSDVEARPGCFASLLTAPATASDDCIC